MRGGITRIGAGRMTLVMAVSVTACQYKGIHYITAHQVCLVSLF